MKPRQHHVPNATPPHHICDGCGDFNNPYMLKNPVWRQIMPSKRGFLCLGCVAERLGRPLTLLDFTETPINRPIFVAYEMGLRDGRAA